MPPVTFLPQSLKNVQGQDATYATTPASETYSLSHPITFISSPHFHQKLHDPLLNVEFTFAVAGTSAEEAKTTVVVFLPAAAGRWSLIGMHGYAKKHGLRLIAIDKPGFGGTPRCKLQERHEIVAKMHEALFKALDLRNVTFIAASAGFIHFLHFLRTRSDFLLSSSPTIYLLSPWVPHTAGQRLFSLLPDPIIKYSHVVLPPVNKVLGLSFSAWSISSGLWKQTDLEDKDDDKPKSISKEFISPKVNSLIQKLAMQEDIQSMSEEYRMCINRERGVASEEWMMSAVTDITKLKEGLVVKVWFGADDAIVPTNGQEWMKKMFKDAGVTYEETIIPDQGHEGPMFLDVGVGAVLDAIAEAATSQL